MKHQISTPQNKGSLIAVTAWRNLIDEIITFNVISQMGSWNKKGTLGENQWHLNKA